MVKPVAQRAIALLALALAGPWVSANGEEPTTRPESPTTSESSASVDSQPESKQPTTGPSSSDASQTTTEIGSSGDYQTNTVRPDGSTAKDESSPASSAEVAPTIPVRSATDQKASSDLPTKEDATRLDEIVVTANKRAQALDQIAGSVGAVRGEQLEKTNAKNLEDVLKLIPGVSLNKQEMGGYAPSIRGISTGTTLGISQAATGIYIDDVAFTGPYASFHTIDMNPFDLERVEVLEGPQATLYGTNSLSGAIRYILEKPKLDVWEAKGSLDHVAVADGQQRFSGAVAVNIPIGSEIAVRVSGTRSLVPGYVDDFSSPKHIVDANSADQQQGRVLAKWAPSSLPLKIAAAYMTQDTHEHENSFADQTQTYSRTNSPSPQFVHSSFNLASLTGQYDWDGLSLFSSTSIQHKFLDLVTDGARALGTQGQSITTTTVPATSSEQALSQEFRLSSPDDGGAFSWLGGLLYSKYQDRLLLGIHQAPRPALVPDVYNETTSSTGTERAVFGEATLNFWKRFTFTAGGRYYKAVLDSNSHLDGLLTLAATGMPTADALAVLAQTGFSPKVSLRFQASDSVSVYGLVSRGARFGGNQFLKPPAATSTAATVPPTYRGDTLWNYELGLRSEWFSRKLRVDLTGFDDEWKDLQIQRAALNGLYHYVDNVGAARSRGIQLGMRFAPFTDPILRGLSLSSAEAYIDARTTVAFQAGTGLTVPAGSRLPGTPKFQPTNTLVYDVQFGNFEPELIVTHCHIGTSPSNIFGQVPIGGYSTLDVDLRLTLLGWQLAPTIALSAHNALNVKAISGATADPASSYVDYYFAQPRTLRASISFSFL